MAMAPSGLAAPRTIPPISHGAQGGVELRSSLSGRALAKARPPSKTHSSRAASRLAVRAARQVGVQGVCPVLGEGRNAEENALLLGVQPALDWSAQPITVNACGAYLAASHTGQPTSGSFFQDVLSSA